MPFHFCPQCGTKLQSDFRFCPSCGEKLPVPAGAGHDTSPAASNTSCGSGESLVSFSPASISPRPPLWTSRRFVTPSKQEKCPAEDTALLQGSSPVLLGGKRARASPLKARTPPLFQQKDELEALEAPLAKKPPTPGKGRRRSLRGQQEEKHSADDLPTSPCSPFSKATPRGETQRQQRGTETSPQSRGKSRNARRVSAVKLLEEGEELTDTAGRKWRLGELLSQTPTDLVYEVYASSAKESKHILKLGAKDGRIFNEQNFLQRAAKASSVDKWVKSTKVDFLGLPSCLGFGLHADSYRFLIFPSMGQTLQSVLETRGGLPSERVVLQLGCRILDVLTFIHSNEYVHGDINAENIYISTEGSSQVFLAGYSHAFRYCPGGQHVEHRQASRTPHEGALEYISLDSHEGAGPSRRSDLQSLGYCMLHWQSGALPWAALTDPQAISTQKQRFLEDVPALLTSCFGKNRVSSAMQQYLTRVMALGYADTPDYTTLQAGLQDALLQLGGALEQPLSF